MTVILEPFIYTYELLILYIAIMGAYRAFLDKRLSIPAIIILSPMLVTGIVMDVVVNIFSTILFLDLPREYLLTSRLIRYMKEEQEINWRYKTAKFVCSNLLDVFDPSGFHCIKKK